MTPSEIAIALERCQVRCAKLRAELAEMRAIAEPVAQDETAAPQTDQAVAREREACARLIEDWAGIVDQREVAAAIRARGRST